LPLPSRFRPERGWHAPRLHRLPPT
jgi:hypothetical protein